MWKGSLAWQNRVLWGPACFFWWASLWPAFLCPASPWMFKLGERFSGLVRKKSAEAELVVTDGRLLGGGWERLPGLGACCRILFTGAPSHPMSLAVGGESQARRRRALLLKAYCQWGLYWSREEGICLHCLLLLRFCQEMLGLDCLLPLGGRSKIPCT